MKQPFWKKLLSYITEIEIEHSRSIYNDGLTVSLVKGEYQLTTAEAIYSYGLRYDNYYTAFKNIHLDKVGKDVLLLGLGLGSIPYMLERSFDQSYNYTAVEIDEEIIHLASKYVLNSLDSEIYTQQADAINYIALNEVKFDMIAMDIFVSDYIPEVFETRDYLLQLKNTLSADGVVLFNRLYYYEKDKKKTKQYYEEIFLDVFPTGGMLDINGNWILVSDKSYLKG